MAEVTFPSAGDNVEELQGRHTLGFKGGFCFFFCLGQISFWFVKLFIQLELGSLWDGFFIPFQFYIPILLQHTCMFFFYFILSFHFNIITF